jgi:GGDEF domain-containing protein
MAEQFIDTIAEHITGAIQQEIGEELFDQWSANNLDEGEAYAEFMFMRFASDELKQQYNEYYGYIEGDEFLL